MNRERNEDVVEDSIPSRARNRPTGKQRVSNVSQKHARRVEAASRGTSGTGTATLTRPRPTRPRQPVKQQAAKRENLLVRWIKQLFKFFNEVIGELRKVIWPTRSEMVTYTTVVLVFLAVMVSLIGGLDFGFVKAVSWLFG